LLKPGFEDPQAVFGDRLEDLDTYVVSAGDTTGTLYVARTAATPPEWTRLFDGHTDRPLNLERPNFGAVFLLRASGRGFAVTFGIGIITTVFTAFTLTRLIVAGWVWWRRPQYVPI